MSPTRFPRLWVLVGALLMVVSCAGAPKPSPSPPRAKDTAPERLAALRAAAPQSLTLEQDEQRWGFEAARERRRQQEAARARQQPAVGDKAVDVMPAAPR